MPSTWVAMEFLKEVCNHPELDDKVPKEFTSTTDDWNAVFITLTYLLKKQREQAASDLPIG
jgi:hypothetical protein